jgi:hypothetical protein
MRGGRGYVTSATPQINEAAARLVVRDIERYAKFDESTLGQKLLAPGSRNLSKRALLKAKDLPNFQKFLKEAKKYNSQ